MGERKEFTVRLTADAYAGLKAFAVEHGWQINPVLEALVQLLQEMDDDQRRVLVERTKAVITARNG